MFRITIGPSCSTCWAWRPPHIIRVDFFDRPEIVISPSFGLGRTIIVLRPILQLRFLLEGRLAAGRAQAAALAFDQTAVAHQAAIRVVLPKLGAAITTFIVRLVVQARAAVLVGRQRPWRCKPGMRAALGLIENALRSGLSRFLRGLSKLPDRSTPIQNLGLLIACHCVPF
jgi:hypothetical protein